MSYSTLKRGDKGTEVVKLQKQINKTGAMLHLDGDFGPSTQRGVLYAQDIAGHELTGIVEQILWEWVEEYPKPSELLDTDGIAFIAKEETGGLGYYDLITKWPHFPGYASGITIGVGYDLRFNPKEDFIDAWGDYLPINYINELEKDIGKKGTKDRARELKEMGISIPFKYAWPVFVNNILPEYYNRTESIYPLLKDLPDLCRSVLVSLVFNRGTKLSGSTRREMKNIRDILSLVDIENITKNESKNILLSVEDEILSMKRLWAPQSGLIKRRQSEANLWREGLKSW